MRTIILTGLAGAMLAGCATGGDPRLMTFGAQRSPDEFAILPTGPLQSPPDMAALPTPTPGGRNLVDPDPRADAVAALGGRVTAERTGAIPAADAALVRHAARGGAQEDIRETLAAEDLDHRRRNRGRLLERMFGVNVYHRAYRDQVLDRDAETERWRQACARTPGAPPRPE